MDEEINKGNLNDYNNQGIDVTTSNRKDSDDCIFTYNLVQGIYYNLIIEYVQKQGEE